MDVMTVDVKAIVREMDNVPLAQWSEEKKKDFVRVFQIRAQAAKFIYFKTAEYILDRARSKRILSHKHTATFREECVLDYRTLIDHKPTCSNLNYCHCNYGIYTVGGRTSTELEELARQRGESILEDLPSVRKAMSIIQPDIARKMDRRDVLRKEGQALVDSLEPLSKPLRMRELDPKMTLGEFLGMTEEIEKTRDEISAQLAKIGSEGCRLESQINEALFEGIPELSEAVLKVAKDHYERGVFFDQTCRRVEERVIFGDSKEAMTILQHFENDEIEVSSSIKAEFSGALERLQLMGKKRKKKGD